jgi:hypothetical protein
MEQAKYRENIRLALADGDADVLSKTVIIPGVRG